MTLYILKRHIIIKITIFNTIISMKTMQKSN